MSIRRSGAELRYSCEGHRAWRLSSGSCFPRASESRPWGTHVRAKAMSGSVGQRLRLSRGLRIETWGTQVRLVAYFFFFPYTMCPLTRHSDGSRSARWVSSSGSLQSAWRTPGGKAPSHGPDRRAPERAHRPPDAEHRSAQPARAAAGAIPAQLGTARRALWVFNFGLACCAIEFIATSMARHDFSASG